jgi:glycosyltransferase involved in cell wall biosynthesis
MPILEAGLIGLPIISTPIPAVQDLLPDGALIFEKGLEPGQLAEQILNWIKNKPN